MLCLWGDPKRMEAFVFFVIVLLSKNLLGDLHIIIHACALVHESLFECTMVTDAPIGHIYYEGSLLAREIQQYRKKSFGIGICTNIVFAISVPESTADSTEIPIFIRYSQLCKIHIFNRRGRLI